MAKKQSKHNKKPKVTTEKVAEQAIKADAAPVKLAHTKQPADNSTSSSPTNSKSAGSGSSSRRLKKPRYKSFRLEKRIKYKAPATPGTYRILRESLTIIRKNWKVMLGISAVYAILYVLFVRGIGGGLDFVVLKEEVSSSLDGLLGENEGSGLLSVFGLVSVLLVNPAVGNQTNVAANFYQSVLFIVFVLALIWALRQIQAGRKIGIKDAFYKGMYPLIPFLLVLIIIVLQSLPIVLGNLVFQIVHDPESPIALSLAEQILWALFWFMMFVATIYMISGSVFGLIIVTLTDMTPIRALRGAYELVRFRRLAVIRRLVVFLLILLVSMMVIMLPVLLWAVGIASFVYTLWSVFVITLMVTFLYTMYRRMLPRD